MKQPRICFAFNEELMEKGIKSCIATDFNMYPHMAIAGVTGTGKTYLTKLIAGRNAMFKTEFYVCDFKGGDDYAFLEGCKHFGKFEECKKIFDMYFEKFNEIRSKGLTMNPPRFLVFDEWASFLNTLDKKESEEYKSKLGIILMLGRSFNFHVILSQQRLDAEYFGKYRDNFSMIVVLGNPSKEVISMFFNDYKDRITNQEKRGTGYALINNSSFFRIKVISSEAIDFLERTLASKCN